MSDIGYQELKYLCDQYLKLPDGKEQAEKIRYAIKRADELGIQEWRLVHRHNLIYQYCLWEDEGKLMPLLAEFVIVFEEQPMTEYVSHYLYAQALREGKVEQAKEYQKKALGTFRKSYHYYISPCMTCKLYRKARYALDNKDWKRAMYEAKPILDGRMTCNEHPKVLLNDLQDFALDYGNWKEAKECMERLEALQTPDWEEHSWSGMRYYAFIDLEKSLAIFKSCVDYVFQSYNQSGKRAFYEDAYVLWTRYAKEKDSVALELPKNFPLYQENGIYEPSVLADWFLEEALAIAKYFDKRNGYPYFQEMVLRKKSGMEKIEQNEDYLAELSGDVSLGN